MNQFVLRNLLLATPAAFLSAVLGGGMPAEAEVVGAIASTTSVDIETSTPVVSVPAASTLLTLDAPAPTASTTVPVAPASAPVLLPANEGGVLNQLNQYTEEGQGTDSVGQVTSVNQLSDVRPTDWAFEALSRLIENYGCIAGYPDGTYRGNRALTRYEFAAGLNACLDALAERLGGGGVSEEDLQALRQLVEEFRGELATIRGIVDNLEARTTELEENQFSTTTRLVGETIFAFSDMFGGDRPDRIVGGVAVDQPSFGSENNTVLQSRVRLNFDTSFFGTDRLRARLQFGNFNRFTEPGNGEARLGFETLTRDNNVVLDTLSYQFNLSGRIRVGLFANGVGLDEAVFGATINPLDSSARGAISRFGQRNPIYRTIGSGAGAGLEFQLTNPALTDNRFFVQVGYIAPNASNPAISDPIRTVPPAAPLITNTSNANSLFSGDYGLIAQFTGRRLLGGNLDVAFTYVNAYTANGGIPWGVGSGFARVNVTTPTVGGVRTAFPVVTNSYGLQANFRITPQIQIGGWAGFTAARAIGLGDADIWNYAITLGISDLGREGSLLGIVAGAQPMLTGSDTALAERISGARANTAAFRRRDVDTSLFDNFFVEAFYRFPLTDNIDITPGLMWVSSPNALTTGVDDIFVGTIRTTFRF